MFEQLLAAGADVAVLRLAVLFFVFVLTYSLFSRIPAVSDKKVAVMLAIVISILAVLGFSDAVVVSIIAGYSGIGLVLLFLLPIIVLVAVLFWRSDSPGASIIKLFCAVFLLLFIELVTASALAFDTNHLSLAGYGLSEIVDLFTFMIYVVIFYFGFDVLSKVLFNPSRQQRS